MADGAKQLRAMGKDRKDNYSFTKLKIGGVASDESYSAI